MCQCCHKQVAGGGGGLSPSQTVNPISTREADYARHSTTSPFGFSDLGTALGCITLLTTTNFREDMSELTKYDYVYLQQGI